MKPTHDTRMLAVEPARLPVAGGDSSSFEFRGVTEVGEVERLLALRHRVYCETVVLHGYVDEGGPPLMLDAYDRYAHLYGLFERTETGSRLVGTVRAVGLELGPAWLALQMVAEGHPRLAARLGRPRRERLPSLELGGDRGAFSSCVTRALARGETVAEAGRLALDPAFRGRRGTRSGFARLMIESLLAMLFVPGGWDHGFIACASGHLGLYRRLGLRAITPGPCLYTPRTNAPAACLHVTREMVAPDVRAAVETRAAEYAMTGRITLGPAAGSRRDPGTPYSPAATIRGPAPEPAPHAALRVASAG